MVASSSASLVTQTVHFVRVKRIGIKSLEWRDMYLLLAGDLWMRERERKLVYLFYIFNDTGLWFEIILSFSQYPAREINEFD